MKIRFLTPVKKDETDEIQTDRNFFLAGEKVKSEVSHRKESVYFLTRGQLHIYYFLPLVIVNNKTNLCCVFDQFRPLYMHQKTFNAWFMKSIVNNVGSNLI